MAHSQEATQLHAQFQDAKVKWAKSQDVALDSTERKSGKLKRLSIACCYGMVCEGLVEAFPKLPLLEELSLTHTDITTERIEALGYSCPRLKSFKLNNSCYMGTGYYSDGEDGRNEEALAIARNLPALHHLQLICNSMTNEGLQAILDGCPHLVSLDLRLCSNLNLHLNEVLSSRISRHIKDMKYPNDSMRGFTFGFQHWGDDVDENNMSSNDDIYDGYFWF
ncbi:putative F-box/LRR-repeat protein 23 [Nicotiana tabacum]|uniref:F-box/LRR-repeat protein 23 n=1 Tax=Nicotiana tabacum TaxID=4097 RepID=A0AC58UI20_TOBAC